MKNKIPTLIACAWLATSVVSFAANSGDAISAPAVPEAIKPSSTDSPWFAATAKGVQIYECRAKTGDPTQFEWVFKAPEAELFDRAGKKIGKHYGGPTWEASDGSKVLGELKARAEAKDPNAIPWLLLGAKTHEGQGIFSHVTSIQRIDTVGGQAPAGGGEGTKVGQEIRVPYTATYYFYVARP